MNQNLLTLAWAGKQDASSGRATRSAALGILMIAAALLLGGFPAVAGFDEGIAAHRRGDYAAALGELTPLAESGSADAQYVLGGMYALGQGVGRNLDAARQWYRLAADQGHLVAIHSLGVMRYFGNGVRQDYEVAGVWFQKAAEGGHAQSQVNLATMYMLGQGVWRDAGLARHWFRQAAEQDDPLAQFNLGMLYELGEGTERSPGKAVYWYRRSASQGFEGATERLGTLGGIAAVEPDPLEPAKDETPVSAALADAGAELDTAEPPATADEASLWRAHIASYRSPGGVSNAWEVLRDEMPALVSKLALTTERIDLGAEKGIYYRLLAGPFASRDDAGRFCKALKGEKPDAWCMPAAVAQ